MKEVLMAVGLTENEANIYLVLLRNGPLTASAISSKTNLHRSYTYEALERLIEKGFAGYSLKDGKKSFQAAPPESILEIARLKFEAMEKIMPQLKKIKGKPSVKAEVEVYSGKHIYAILLRRMGKPNITNYLLGFDESLFLEAEPIYIRQYINNLGPKNIKEKVIALPGTYKFDHPNLEYRELKEKFIGNILEVVSGDEVGQIVPGPENTLIIIKDAKLAKAHRQRFEFFWKRARKPKT
jgi:sugar-specific transcriptional regulator TrmB